LKVKTKYWETLLKIKNIYKEINVACQTMIVTNNFEVLVSSTSQLPNNGLVLIRFNDQVDNHINFFELIFNDTVSKKSRKIFTLYLPYILVNKRAYTPFAIVHIAQTIDGKIATPTGKSKWIGNQENLVHAHRTRALVDAILVGATTFKLDKPRLDVRHVNGDNPIKIIISNSKLDLECLSEGKTLLFSKNKIDYDHLPETTETICIDKKGEFIDINQLLQILKQKDIHSLLIEGGSQTIKYFIESNTLNRIEFHIAPMLFGSGKNGIELNEIDALDQAITFDDMVTYKMGNAVMMVSNFKT
jgi:diaminohydroxyphosphoribosylaminopyrimidine deaminase/5-amino-6-(5-phosphoribosylamino)uracil reductase